MVLSSLFLALAATMAPAGDAPAPPAALPQVPAWTPPELTLEPGGRAVVLGAPEGPRTLWGREGTVACPRRGELELGGGARAGLPWTGRSTARPTGPASIAWDEPATGGLALVLYSAKGLNLEARRGHVELDLPQSWHARVEGGVLFAQTQHDGSARIARDAGEPLVFGWLGDRNSARPPRICAPGETVHLVDGARQSAPVDVTARAPAWRNAGWAWPRGRSTEPEPLPAGTPSEGPPVETPAAPARSNDSTASHGRPLRRASARSLAALELRAGEGARAEARATPGGVVPVPLRLMVEPLLGEWIGSAPALGEVLYGPPLPPEDRAPRREDREGREAECPEDECPEVSFDAAAAELADATSVEPAPPGAAFAASEWRGLERERLLGVSDFAVERNPALRVEELPGGICRVLLSYGAGEGAWLFGARKDLFLSPGAVVVVAADGTLEGHYGAVRFEDAVAGRPRFAQLAAQ